MRTPAAVREKFDTPLDTQAALMHVAGLARAALCTISESGMDQLASPNQNDALAVCACLEEIVRNASEAADRVAVQEEQPE